METTVMGLYRGFIGILENKMETTMSTSRRGSASFISCTLLSLRLVQSKLYTPLGPVGSILARLRKNGFVYSQDAHPKQDFGEKAKELK